MLSLRISDLTHEYGEREVISELNFSFNGGCLAVTGYNGAGKSTLLRVIAGLITPTFGEAAVFIDDTKVSRENLRDVVGIVAPDIRLYHELTAKENLQFISHAKSLCSVSCKQIDEALDFVGLADRKNDPLCELSSGLRQRVSLAAAILHQPAFLLLDEPSTNLDDMGSDIVRALIDRHRENGMVILATNSESEAAAADMRLSLGGAQ